MAFRNRGRLLPVALAAAVFDWNRIGAETFRADRRVRASRGRREELCRERVKELRIARTAPGLLERDDLEPIDCGTGPPKRHRRNAALIVVNDRRRLEQAQINGSRAAQDSL